MSEQSKIHMVLRKDKNYVLETSLNKLIKKSVRLDRKSWLQKQLSDNNWSEIKKLRKGSPAQQGRLQNQFGVSVSSEHRSETMAHHFETIQWAVRPSAAVSTLPPLHEELPVNINDISEEEVKTGALIDGHDNQYTLMRPHDLTVPHQDVGLVEELLITICMCFFLGTMFRLIGLPSFLGHMAAGTVLGPMGLGKLRHMVQLDSLGKFCNCFFVALTVILWDKSEMSETNTLYQQDNLASSCFFLCLVSN